jgi:hypothetical protein
MQPDKIQGGVHAGHIPNVALNAHSIRFKGLYSAICYLSYRLWVSPLKSHRNQIAVFGGDDFFGTGVIMSNNNQYVCAGCRFIGF